jgi:5-methyltetrahydropteroyltriglutamate--homocysteine methyltransferase
MFHLKSFMRMLKNNLGYPRIGSSRQLKKACEQYWAGSIGRDELFLAGKKIREDNWRTQQQASIDLIPCNDFSYYDQMLDMSLLLGVIPERYTAVLTNVKGNAEIDLCFAMARGYQQDDLDISAMEMTKWFDTNYHYIVPEFSINQSFQLFSDKIFHEFNEGKIFLGFPPKPVIVGPVSYLLLGKEKGTGFHRMTLLKKLLPVYIQLINRLADSGAQWIQMDEPMLVMDLTEAEREAMRTVYSEINKKCRGVKILLATYFECTGSNLDLAAALPVAALHVDLIRCPAQLEDICGMAAFEKSDRMLSLGVVNGRNIWKNNYDHSLQFIRKAIDRLGKERIMIAPSCSLLHTPFDIDLETDLPEEKKRWMAFAKQKLNEINELHSILENGKEELLLSNRKDMESRKTSQHIHKPAVKKRIAQINPVTDKRNQAFAQRQKIQRDRFQLPLFPTTTIGSFPQTDDIRQLRAKLKKGTISTAAYDSAMETVITEAIRWQEEIGLDVLVHGEFERNDMVEYFGEQLDGFLFTKNGWVQSYGSRCVKPPVIYGDISRPYDMTVRWTAFAQRQTGKLLKGMLTGPVTILQWSFVRDDQPRSETAFQIAFAIRDEVQALEKAGIQVIQIDEPAIREGLPLRKNNWPAYLDWAVKAFRISASGVRDETQIHTHMCYSEFNDIIEFIALMDADVITIETSRSQMELLEAFANFRYPNEIGPGVYDIHSPRVPSVKDMLDLLERASALLSAENLWVNPDCGLKTRKWPETKEALKNMVEAGRQAREKITHPIAG